MTLSKPSVEWDISYMKIKDYLLEKLYFILLGILTYGIIALFLYGIGNNLQAILVISLLYWGMLFAILVIEYVRRASFYRRLIDTAHSLDEKYLLTEMMEEPLFLDGKILMQVLRDVDKSMADHVNLYRSAQAEYKDYVEMWVHEIKTPLAAAKLVISNNPSEITISLQEEIEKVEAFVEQALFYARSTSVEKDYIIKELSLQECISKIIRKHSKVFIYQKIKVELDNLDHIVYSDSKWLEFILEQIITNALKYMNKPDKVLRIYADRHENTIHLHIQDNGIGICASDIPRIFERGFTGKNGRTNEKATGMGLYLCKSLCDKLYLGIHVHAIENEGTTITLDFPISRLMLLK